MSSPDHDDEPATATTPTTPSPTDRPRSQATFPPGPPSIISSRMTDMGYDDGIGIGTGLDASADRRRSAYASDVASRPPTARTGMSARSSNAFHHHHRPNSPPQPLRKHALTAAKRASTGAGSIGSSVSRTPSVTNHAPLASHAFFNPMSSQKLQAQRGQSRHQQVVGGLDAVTPTDDAKPTAWRQSVTTINSNQNPIARLASDAGSQSQSGWHGPPSRGTEATGMETIDRATANTSPVHGHNHLRGSITDSMRPLQRTQDRDQSQAQNQAEIQTQNQTQPWSDDHNHNQTGDQNDNQLQQPGQDHRLNVPSPARTPRSFRSSFLLSGLGEGSRNGSNRNVHGAEKLPSATSSPRMRPVDLTKPVVTRSRPTWRQRRAQRRELGKVHEYFDGNTFFCLGGRFQNSRQKPINIATGAVMVIPSVLFFIFEAPWLWHNVSAAVPITFAYVFYICLSSFIHASVADPGILPRNLHPFPPDHENDPLHIGPPTNDWTLVKSSEKSTAAMEVPVKYCRTCNIWRPPRAHHCRLCDNCIESHDHHCVWLNNCVGRRNYRHFFVFLVSGTVLGLYLSALSLAHILIKADRDHVSVSRSIASHRISLGLVVCGLVGFAYPAALMVYHVFLMARGETTREFLNSHKFVKKERFRAFTQAGWILNWVAVLCRPRTPTYYRFKNQYSTGDQRLAPRKRDGWLRPIPPPSRHLQPALEMHSVKPVSQGTSHAPTG